MKKLTNSQKNKIIEKLSELDKLPKKESIFEECKKKLSIISPEKEFFHQITHGVNRMLFFVERYWSNPEKQKSVKYAFCFLNYFLSDDDVISDNRKYGYSDDYFALQYTVKKILSEDPSLFLNWNLDSLYMNYPVVNMDREIHIYDDFFSNVRSNTIQLEKTYSNSFFIKKLVGTVRLIVELLKDDISEEDKNVLINALHYFLEIKDDIPDDYGEFGLFDDYIYSVYALDCVKRNSYKLKGFELLYEQSVKYDTLFHTISFQKNGQDIALSDRHKWIAILGFELGLR